MEKKILVFVISLVLVLFLRLFVFYNTRDSLREGQLLDFKTSITSQPKIYSNYQTFIVEAPKGEMILIKTKPDISYRYGDNLKIFGSLKVKLLENKRLFSMDFPQISLVLEDNLAVFKLIRQKISNVFQKNLSQDDAALLEGIVFGIKENMSKNFFNQLKIAGVMHVIAASGMNITMTAGFIFYISTLILKRQFAIIFTVAGIVFYAAIAGFQPSIIRASIMAIIAFTAQGLGKQAHSLYALFLTAFIMLFLWPKFLLDIGFQLSFLSTLGIILFPKLFSYSQNLVSTDFLTTIYAQLATFPIIISNFGTYSIWSILVNALVLWTVPFLMILGGFAAIFSPIEPFSRIFLYISIPLLSYFENIVSFFTNLGGVVIFENISWHFVISYYLFLFAIIVFIYKKSA